MDKAKQDQKLTYTVPEVAKLLGLSRAATYAAARNGQIPSIRIGRRIIILKIALERMLNDAGTNESK